MASVPTGESLGGYATHKPTLNDGDQRALLHSEEQPSSKARPEAKKHPRPVIALKTDNHLPE